jgi:hypothetical protein
VSCSTGKVHSGSVCTAYEDRDAFAIFGPVLLGQDRCKGSDSLWFGNDAQSVPRPVRPFTFSELPIFNDLLPSRFKAKLPPLTEAGNPMAQKQQYIVRQATTHADIEKMISEDAQNGYELASFNVTPNGGYVSVMRFKPRQ